MDQHSYWQKQTGEKTLFPDIEWSKPEQLHLRGKLGIIGGNKLNFVSVSENYNEANKLGVGEVKILLPDKLKKDIPKNMTNVKFASSNSSGGLSKDALPEMNALADWSNAILMIGDTGQNSETAVLYENFINLYGGLLTITRDAFDLIKNNSQNIIERKDTLLVLSFAQIQKLFQYVYYPKVLTFNMQLTNFIEALHKFTITYPINILVLFKNNLIVACNGEIVTSPVDNPMTVWKGLTATRATAYWLWNPQKPLESISTSLLFSSIDNRT